MELIRQWSLHSKYIQFFHDQSSEHSVLYDVRYCQRHKRNHKKDLNPIFVFYLWLVLGLFVIKCDISQNTIGDLEKGSRSRLKLSWTLYCVQLCVVVCCCAFYDIKLAFIRQRLSYSVMHESSECCATLGHFFKYVYYSASPWADKRRSLRPGMSVALDDVEI
jgi:hypothetical protein